MGLNPMLCGELDLLDTIKGWYNKPKEGASNGKRSYIRPGIQGRDRQTSRQWETQRAQYGAGTGRA
jgi:hypothetical protein